MAQGMQPQPMAASGSLRGALGVSAMRGARANRLANGFDALPGMSGGSDE